MRKRIAIKNPHEEIQLITRRSMTVLVMMVILVALLLLRLGYLQLIKHDLYSTLSNKNSLDLAPLEPNRGLIYDRNGILLAENVPIFSLDVYPYKVDNIPKMLTEIAKIIPMTDVDIVQFQKQLKQHRRFDEIPLKYKLTDEEVSRFAENQYRFPGVFIKARLMRHYPGGSTFSHVLGYVGRINAQELEDIDATNYSATNYIGKSGIEKFYEEELHGTVGYQQAENDASGEPIRVLNQIKPTPGKNLYLTIDSRLQTAAEKAMEGHTGAIVAIQPSTGQVLAMVSEPGFDPNLFVAGISNEQYQTLQQDEKKPLYNRAVRGLYPLASTIKPYFALKALEDDIITPEDTIFDPGFFQLKNNEHRFRDWRPHGHGTVDLFKAIANSCDTYFYMLSLKLGIQRMDDVLKQFGFGENTGLDSDEELAGVIASPAWKRQVKKTPWYEGDTIISAIGQGFMQATPIQLATGVATIANRGTRITPYLVLGEQQPGKNYELQLTAPHKTITLNDPANWNIIINAMQQVITNGTARSLNSLPITIAGKTGTAQVFSKKQSASEDEDENQMNIPEKLRNHNLFIAFAPVDKPQIALAIVVEHSHTALTVAKSILEYYFAANTNNTNTQQTAGTH